MDIYFIIFNLELATFEFSELGFIFVVLSGNSVLVMKCHNIKGKECHRLFQSIKSSFFLNFGLDRFWNYATHMSTKKITDYIAFIFD